MVVLPNEVKAVNVVCAGCGGEVSAANRGGKLNKVERIPCALELVGTYTDETIWVSEGFSMDIEKSTRGI